ncbi:sensor histidine kinase [Cupriavidus agavae]|uniref:histidine kinase n=1 Tax=Cupriavidus agavae TaxID=1001822 RepID=A0A4V2FGI5_9BURK|nr:ATP-binding protein [Cupriavidus agavae]RZT36899.1 phospho-acceptor domain-containing protein [Cupriavidus agavae]
MTAADFRRPATRHDDSPPVPEAVRLVREMAQAFEQRILAGESARQRDGADSAEARKAMRQWESHLVHLSRVATLGTLAASIAHEIRQPLTAIQVETYAIQRWMRRDVPDTVEIDEGIRRIQGESERAERVISSLRALMRREPASCQPFALDAAIADVLPLVEAGLQDAAVLSTVEIEPDLPALRGDRVQIQQVVLNLLVNAVDAARTCQPGTALVRLWARRHGAGHVAIDVTDNGKGIAPEDLERIFAPFFSTKTEGMGVGLAICRLVVESHGGTIHAASEPGRTTMTILLPVGKDRG